MSRKNFVSFFVCVCLRFFFFSVDNGATSVIATHPHVLQPWERYISRDGREALIAYSTGNFVSNQKEWKKTLALAVFVGLSREPGKKAWVHGVAAHPMVMINVPGTLKLVSLPRTDNYQQHWNHVATLIGNDRTLLKTDVLDTCRVSSAAAPGVSVARAPVVVASANDQRVMNSAEECIRDAQRVTRAQTKLIRLGHLSGRADGAWGRGSQASLDKYATARRSAIKTCLTKEYFDLLEAENI